MIDKILTPSFCYFMAFLSVFASTTSQILLKTQANKTERESFFKKFLNIRVILSYGILMLSLAFNQVALIHVPASVVPCITATSFIWIFLFSFIFLKEKPSRKKILGVVLILAGIAISRL